MPSCLPPHEATCTLAPLLRHGGKENSSREATHRYLLSCHCVTRHQQHQFSTAEQQPSPTAAFGFSIPPHYVLLSRMHGRIELLQLQEDQLEMVKSSPWGASAGCRARSPGAAPTATPSPSPQPPATQLPVRGFSSAVFPPAAETDVFHPTHFAFTRRNTNSTRSPCDPQTFFAQKRV